ncbi:MAG: hypothetical protein Q7T74_01260 [Candidatus Saccharibacteria bacterium]|nr:hypothetical protein [Candidatus Saccharibacteria bacterium]
MTQHDHIIDDYPYKIEKEIARFDTQTALKLVTYKVIDNFVQGVGNGFITWVDSSQSWDGHAIAVEQGEAQRILFRYLHVHRGSQELIQEADLEIDLRGGSMEGLATDKDYTKGMVEEALHNFDKHNLTYIYAMLTKAARIGSMQKAAPKNDKSVMNIITADKLDDLVIEGKIRALKEKEPPLPHLSREFFEAVRNLQGVETGLAGKGDREIHLQISFGTKESYAVWLSFSDGNLVETEFIRHNHHEIVGDGYDYRTDGETNAFENAWDLDRIIHTIERGLPMSKASFELLSEEASGEEPEES